MMPLFTVTMPANAGMFFAQMMQIAAFEIIDTKPYLDEYLRLEPSDPVNANFEAVGLESVYFLHNLGTLAVAFVFFVAVSLFSALLVLCTNKKVNHTGEKLQQKLFWGALINLVTESYSMLTVSCMINLRYLQWNAVNLAFMSLLTIVVTLVLLALPIYIGRLLSNNFNVLDHSKFKRKYSAFYCELHLHNGQMVLLQPIWFFVRRFLLAMMVVFCGTTVIWQIALMTTNVVVQVIILGRVKPFALPS